MKIPTILGLFLLTVAIVIGILIFVYKQKVQSELKIVFTPHKIQVVNITDSKATITWQTDIPSSGAVLYSQDQKLDIVAFDDRSKDANQPRLTHFVTLKNLVPNKKYYIKVISSNLLYPDKPISFQTATKSQDEITLPPIRGAIIDSGFNPIDEALIFLKIPLASVIGTFSTTAGNYIFSLQNLRTDDLTGLFMVEPGQEATIVVSRAGIESSAQIIIPKDNKPLPPIILGDNIDLRFEASPSAKPLPQDKLAKYDLNQDGQLNALDASIILDNFGKKPKTAQTDINKDGTVNQKDLDLLKKAFQELEIQ